MEGCSSESTEGILFNANFKVVHITVSVGVSNYPH